MASRVTLKDVARAAGIAPATASYALTSTETVSKHAAAHVRQIALELGYRKLRCVWTATAKHLTMLGSSTIPTSS